MNKIILFRLLFLMPFLGISQYTDVINSNRPGQSVSAYAVGKNVVQAEIGVFYEQQEHNLLLTESDFLGTDFSFRYGFLFEELEINWEGTYQNENLTFQRTGSDISRTNFSRNRLGVKYLIYDPYKNSELSKPNLYSWRANNKFRWKNLIPAVSVYAGASFALGNNPFLPGDPTVSPRVMVATQSTLSPKLVFISNIAYDRIGTDFPEWSYIISLSHALKNPKWSVFIENQGVQSDRYADIITRAGVAHLFSKKFQVDFNIGGSFKNTPSRLFGTLGASYRLDFHKDELLPIEDQAPEDGDGPIKKNSMKKKGKKGISKKEARRKRKAAKKKKKKNKKKKEKEFIEF
ncbi:transporter [Spongiimicrobium salis]|uniref:transporter n=1 Tax=Spongiimicrobium salis TaxID=1667022 RepID=UPI00374CCE3C